MGCDIHCIHIISLIAFIVHDYLLDKTYAIVTEKFAIGMGIIYFFKQAPIKALISGLGRVMRDLNSG